MKQVWTFAGYLILAVLIDHLSIHYAGVSGYCISPAYGFLAPVYGAMWWARSRQNPGILVSIRTVVALVMATTTAFLISNGSFFLFSGRIRGTGWMEYALSIADYYPGYLVSTALYCGLALTFEELGRFKWSADGWVVKAKTR